jgi:hypothetical protein
VNILQRYRELRSMGYGESRAKVTAAIEYARTTDKSMSYATTELEHLLKLAKEQATRPGGML